ncbi:MAG: DUF3576 domain-containing protein [Pseudomonadota bacterium]
MTSSNTISRRLISYAALALCIGLAGCGLRFGNSDGAPPELDPDIARSQEGGTTLSQALFNRRNEERVVQVNRYIWRASLDVLNFLPIQEVDPYTGVIVTGFGTPPGGGQAYRATVLIQDPALDARALNVALQNRRGPTDAATVRAIEDAILTRARQLRIADGRR